MKIVKIYLLCVIGLAALCAIPVRAMQESPVDTQSWCYRCANMPGVTDFNLFYRCKAPHAEKLCRNCSDFLRACSKKGKNPAQCPICDMNSWQLPDNTPFEFTHEETEFIRRTSGFYYDARSSSSSSSRSLIYQQEASRSLKMMYLCFAAITVGLGKYIWHKLKRNRKSIPTEQTPHMPDTTQTDKQ